MIALALRQPRPRTGLALLLTGLALALVACGGDGDDDPGAGAASQQSRNAFPVTIEHKFGTMRVASPPKRVVTVGYNEQDFVLALGVKPVGLREWFGDQPKATWSWARDELGAADPEVLPTAELNFEQIAALRPDLIVGVYSGMTKADYSKLSKIAPTLAQTEEYADLAMPWQEQFMLTGRALGREDRARQIVGEIEDRFAKARREHPEFEQVVAPFAYYEENGKFGAYASTDPHIRFLSSLGFGKSAEIDELAGDQVFTVLSNERLRLLDRDVLVMLKAPETAASRTELLKNPLYRRLDAVRERRDVYPDVETVAALSYSSPLSLPQAIDAMVPQLAEAVARDSKQDAPEG